MQNVDEFSFQLTDRELLRGDSVIAYVSSDEYLRFKLTYWGSTVIAQPDGNDLQKLGLTLHWVEQRRSEVSRRWRKFLSYPSDLARWVATWRYQEFGLSVNRLVVVTNDECGLEIGRHQFKRVS